MFFQVRTFDTAAAGTGMFAAVGFRDSDGVGVAMSSPDGINWTERTISDQFWSSIVYGGGQFVALGFNDAVATSPDGITWTEHLTGISHDWMTIRYGDGIYVAAGRSSGGVGRIMTSPDGENWTLQSDADTNDYRWHGLAYSPGDDLWVVSSDSGANNETITSPDGVAWTNDSDSSNYGWWFGMTYGDGIFVNVGKDTITGPGTFGTVRTSTDGSTWTQRTCPNKEWYAVHYVTDLDLFVAVDGALGSDGPVGTNAAMTSPDGTTWTQRTTPNAGSSRSSWFSLTDGDGIIVVTGIGDNYDIMTSTDGTTWTGRTSPQWADDWIWWFGVAFKPA